MQKGEITKTPCQCSNLKYVPIHSVTGYLVCQRGSKNSARDLKKQIFLFCLVLWTISKTRQMKLFQLFHLSDNKATGKPGQLVLVKNSLIHLGTLDWNCMINIVKPNDISWHFYISSVGISCALDFMTKHSSSSSACSQSSWYPWSSEITSWVRQ